MLMLKIMQMKMVGGSIADAGGTASVTCFLVDNYPKPGKSFVCRRSGVTLLLMHMMLHSSCTPTCS
jgi:hypothetical protein